MPFHFICRSTVFGFFQNSDLAQRLGEVLRLTVDLEGAAHSGNLQAILMRVHRLVNRVVIQPDKKGAVDARIVEDVVKKPESLAALGYLKIYEALHFDAERRFEDQVGAAAKRNAVRDPKANSETDWRHWLRWIDATMRSCLLKAVFDGADDACALLRRRSSEITAEVLSDPAGTTLGEFVISSLFLADCRGRDCLCTLEFPLAVDETMRQALLEQLRALPLQDKRRLAFAWFRDVIDLAHFTGSPAVGIAVLRDLFAVEQSDFDFTL